MNILETCYDIFDMLYKTCERIYDFCTINLKEAVADLDIGIVETVVTEILNFFHAETVLDLFFGTGLLILVCVAIVNGCLALINLLD